MYHHLALGAQDIQATHHFYETIMGFELVKVEVAPIPSGGWGKHFFYRMHGDDSLFIAFWELHDTENQAKLIYDINKGTNMPQGTFHFSFQAKSASELELWKKKWHDNGLDVLEIDHNWCHSVYTNDPDGHAVEFCLTTGEFSEADRQRALDAMTETEFKPSPAPAKIEIYPASDALKT